MIAIAGESATAISGVAIAIASTRRVSVRESTTSGDDSSTTGNSVMLPIDQSETTSSRAATAAAIGSRSGNRKATSTCRRTPVCRPKRVFGDCAQARARRDDGNERRQCHIGGRSAHIAEPRGERVPGGRAAWDLQGIAEMAWKSWA